MPAAWPGTLPQDVFVEGYNERFGGTRLRTQMEKGPAKQRRRGTAAAKPLRVGVPLTRAQVAIFESFYEDDLEGGTLDFTWLHPRKLTTVTFRFVEDPDVAPDSGQSWRASLALEIMP